MPRNPLFQNSLKGLLKRFLWANLLLFCLCSGAQASCVGRFLNPVTDICWSCVFPITIAGAKIGSGEDAKSPKDLVCLCKDPPRAGIPISFWEPVRLIDITRTPYCMVGLGGITLGPSHQLRGAGSVGQHTGGTMKKSFYQVHWYAYPLLHVLQILIDFVCMEQGDLDVLYITEIDPLWIDDEMSFIINPEAALFGNPIAQAACAADCLASNVGFPMDGFMWCGGCQGSLYPFTGDVSAHSNGIQASLLLTQRMIAKLHREGLEWGYIGKQGLCKKYPMPVINKSQYKTQMTYPIPTTHKGGCHPLGRFDGLWSAGKQFPYKGEDFGYMIWRKRSCCLL